jgi:hypothetical protein
MTEKRLVPVYNASPDCPLTLPQLLVYSYCVYQWAFAKRPTYKVIANATGLDAETPSSAVEALREIGLIADDGTPDTSNCRGWFRAISTETHPYQFWQSYVRARHAQDFTCVDACLYSYLYRAKLDGREPSRGWNNAYVATVLHASRDTIAESRKRLENVGLLRWDDEGPAIQRLERWSREQAALFADKGCREVKGGNVRFLDDENAAIPYSQKKPNSATATGPEELFQGSVYVRILERWPHVPEHHAKSIAAHIVKHQGTPDVVARGWEGVAEEIVNEHFQGGKTA